MKEIVQDYEQFKADYLTYKRADLARKYKISMRTVYDIVARLGLHRPNKIIPCPKCGDTRFIGIIETYTPYSVKEGRYCTNCDKEYVLQKGKLVELEPLWA